MTFSKRFIYNLFVGAIATIIHSNGHAQSIPSKEYDLTEFQLTVNIPGLSPIPVKCTDPQIKDGLIDLMWLGEGPKPGRTLKPSTQPMHREGSWLFKNDVNGCPALAPYFNGIGIDTIDLTTGQTRFYLASFFISDSTLIESASADEISQMRAYFQPEFNQKNVVYFEGRCDLQTPPAWKLWQSEKLVCHLGEDNLVVLTRRKR